MRSLSTLFLFALFLVLPFMSYGQAIQDPASIPVYTAEGPITIDGNINEATWSVPAPYLRFRAGAVPTWLSNTPTNGVLVKGNYLDTSTCIVKFLRIGTDLYISLNSDDKQVCRFGDSWEGDGMFMKIKNSTGTDVEIKLYYNLAGADPEIHYEGPVYGTAAGVKKAGTIVNDSTNVDAGYTAELKIDLTGLGFTAATTSVQVLINIFDPDNYNDGVIAFGPNGTYYKQWWGSEWGPDERTLQLLAAIVPVELKSFTASYVGSSARLQWATATEINNRGFEVQRSVNNSEFAQVGFVPGNGTTTSPRNYTYVDDNINAGTNYSYRLKQIDFDGRSVYSDAVELGTSLPVDFNLAQNYPNPFNPDTKLSFSVPVKSDITIDVYNLIGQKVMSVANGSFEPGVYDMKIDGSKLTSGMYIYTISAVGENGAKFSSSKKMVLMK